MQPSPFGQLLRHFRGRSGWTQEQLAARADLPRDTICKIERGLRSAPRSQTIHKLGVALDLSPDECVALERAAFQAPPALPRRHPRTQTPPDPQLAYVTAVLKGVSDLGQSLEHDRACHSA